MNFIYQRVSEHCCSPWWMESCYHDYATRENVMVAWPLGIFVKLTYGLWLALQIGGRKKTWIDRMLEDRYRRDYEELENLRSRCRSSWMADNAILALEGQLKRAVAVAEELKEIGLPLSDRCLEWSAELEKLSQLKKEAGL